MTTLHPGLAGPWARCEAVRRDLLAAVAPLDDTAWSRPGESGRWSVAQQVDHLLKSEVGTSKLVRKLIRGDYAELSRPADAPLHGGDLDRYPYGPLDAPVLLVPSELRRVEAAARLAATQARLLEELGRFDGPDPEAIAAPDPATGVWFSLAGWMALHALHERHHLGGVHELLRRR